MTLFEVVTILCVLAGLGSLIAYLHSEHERAERAWDSIAELRRDVDVLCNKLKGKEVA